jgi:hypothetical protein
MPLPGSPREVAMQKAAKKAAKPAKKKATIQEVANDGEKEFLQEVNVPQYELDPDTGNIDEVEEEPEPEPKPRKKLFGLI